MGNQFYLWNEKYEILETANGDCYIKSIQEKKYYFKRHFFASKNPNIYSIKKVVLELKDIVYLLLACCSVWLLVYLLLNINRITTVNTSKNNVVAVIYLLVNLVLHEIGHRCVLKSFGRMPGGVKFKFSFIFPTITVDTTDSYILPKFRRFMVYYAGVMVNIIICFITFIFFKDYNYCIISVLWFIIFNLIPIPWVNTDGYYILFVLLLNVNSFKKKKSIIMTIGKIAFCTATSILLIVNIIRSLGLY